MNVRGEVFLVFGVFVFRGLLNGTNATSSQTLTGGQIIATVDVLLLLTSSSKRGAETSVEAIIKLNLHPKIYYRAITTTL